MYHYPVITKFFYGKTDDSPSYEGNNKDRMKFRLAETYLLLAEARIRQNNASGAAEAINVVRNVPEHRTSQHHKQQWTSCWMNVSANWLAKNCAV